MARFSVGDATVADDSHTGENVLAAAQRFIGANYVLWGRLNLADPHHTDPWDCSELCSWTLYHTTGILYGAAPARPLEKANAYTGLWAQHSEERGRRIEVAEALRIPGAYLLREETTLIGGHIALSDGQGGTMEARSRDYGVGAWSDAARRVWDYGVLVPGVSYLAGPEVAYTPRGSLLRLGMNSKLVTQLQEALGQLGFYRGAVDGDFGRRTELAVAAYQDTENLVTDGEVGAETAERLGLDLTG